MTISDQLRDEARGLQEHLTTLRHELHQSPEVGLHLPATQELVLRDLDDLGLEVSTGQELTSVTAVLRGDQQAAERPAVLLRADMDALPLQEASGVDFTSRNDGAMHACGHDLHTAMLLGAARLLSGHREQLAGDVVFMFQPGEEGWDGAGHMLREGVLEAAGQRVSSAYGMHVFSSRYPRGTFTTRGGTLMAASDALFVTAHGQGGHGSAPHMGRDPISAAAQIITALQTLVTRRFSVFDPVVLTVGNFHAGTRYNIIPDDATFQATIRTFSSAAREQMRELAPALCRQVGASFGVEVDAEYHQEYPVTVNDDQHVEFVQDVVRDVFGSARTETLEHPVAGAEDFSRVLAEVPGCYLFLGAHMGDHPQGPDNHSPRAAFHDDVLSDGALLHSELAVRALVRDAA